MKYSVAAKSLIGRIRKNNEDNYCIDGESLPLSHGDTDLKSRELTSSSPHILGVFDGMGGYSDGENASYLAASTVRGYMEKLGSQQAPAEILTQLCFEANDIVCDAADGSQMGTTCVLLCLNGSDYTICNVGDSPAFLVRNGAMEQLSEDHNQKATYEIATGKPAKPGQKFKLTQCIGIPKTEMLIEPFTLSGKLQDKDFFLLCSDGVTDMLTAEEIRNTILETKTPDKAVCALTEKALAAGGRDNITVICVKAEASHGFAENLAGLVKKLFC